MSANPRLPSRVTVVGLGLMGGSVARALKSLPNPPFVIGAAASPSDGQEALAAGAIDHLVRSVSEAFEGTELIIYATPLGSLIQRLSEDADRIPGNATITDVCSLKEPVLAEARRRSLDEQFVGSHPMIGGEGSGFAASRPGMFSDVRVWITDDAGSDAAQDAVSAMWHAFGAEPAMVSAADHDRGMVWLSHLPQLVANALAKAIEGAGLRAEDLGPGGLDMTRLAASSPTMWKDLFEHASARDAAALQVVARELHALAGALERGRADEVARVMEETRRWRQLKDLR